MKEKIKTLFCVAFLMYALPYIITTYLQGKGSEDMSKDTESEAVLSAKTAGDSKVPENLDVEEYLVGIVAHEIPISYETEALKAQAVIARTNLMAALEQGTELPESLSREKLMELWGEESFTENYSRLSEAVAATAGVVMTYQGSYPYAAFHAVSAGSTRNAEEALGNTEMPWLAGVDSSMDIPSEDYLTVIFLEKQEFLQRLRTAFGELPLTEDAPLEGFVIAARDSTDYAVQITMGEVTVTGEEVRTALSLSSACFYIKEVEGQIRIVTKGLGHGLGMSQYGANVLAKDGSDYRTILNYYFKNIEISD